MYVPVVITLFLGLVLVTIIFSLLTLGSLTGEMIALSTLTFTGFITAFSMLAGLFTKVVIGYLVGRWLLEKMTKLEYTNFWHHFAALALGVFLYELLRSIPVFGFFLVVVVVMIGMGAFFSMLLKAVRKSPPQAGTDVVAA